MTATRETYKLGIDIINPAPIGTGGDMLQDDIKTIADLLESHATSIAGKASTFHTHATSDVTGLDTALDGKANASHTHTESEITGLVTDLAGKANTSHTHATSDVTGLDTALDGKADASHTHTESEITGLVTDLAGKASTSHTHATSDVTGLDTALDGKANASHTHAESEITGLVTDLAGKANTSHTHATSDVTGLDTALDSKANTSHTHAESDIAGLVTDLAGKQDSLVSGTNIKTINNQSLLGSGNITVGGGEGTTYTFITPLLVNGNNEVSITAASSSVAGSMSATDKAKLDQLDFGDATEITAETPMILLPNGERWKADVLPIATESSIGCVKQGNNITIASDGTISATGSGSSVSVDGVTVTNTNGTLSVANSQNCTVKGTGSIALGQHNTDLGDYSVAFGVYNRNKLDGVVCNNNDVRNKSIDYLMNRYGGCGFKGIKCNNESTKVVLFQLALTDILFATIHIIDKSSGYHTVKKILTYDGYMVRNETEYVTYEGYENIFNISMSDGKLCLSYRDYPYMTLNMQIGIFYTLYSNVGPGSSSSSSSSSGG